MPKQKLTDESKNLMMQVENLRQTRSKNAALIEEKLRNFTVNANMNLTQNKPKLSDPEQKFRDHVDQQVDMMNRYSIHKLKKTVDIQRANDYKKALL